jgi:hypothetical protein
MKSLVGSYWNIIILVRWTITNAVMLLISNYPALQTQLLLGISVCFQCMILGGRPHISTFENLLALFNELMVSTYLYLLLLLTDFFGENS